MTKSIVSQNKALFLQQLLFEEVVEKREHNLKAFFKGLNYHKIGDLIKAHPILTRSLLVAEVDKTITSEKFFDLVESPRPVAENQWLLTTSKEFALYLEGMQ